MSLDVTLLRGNSRDLKIINYTSSSYTSSKPHTLINSFLQLIMQELINYFLFYQLLYLPSKFK